MGHSANKSVRPTRAGGRGEVSSLEIQRLKARSESGICGTAQAVP